jgi:cytochrome b
VNASTNSTVLDVTESHILAAASSSDGSSILGALAIASVWILVLAAVLFGVLAPLNNSFACGSAGNGELRASNSSFCEYRKV